MNEQAIQEQYQLIIALLKQRRLREAQTQLEALLWHSGDETLHRRLEQAQTSYHYLLQYLRQGIDDPERDKQHRRLLLETWETADQARINLLDKASARHYHSLRRQQKTGAAAHSVCELRKTLENFADDLAVCQLMPDNRTERLKVMRRHEEAADALFYRVWTDAAWNTDEAQEMQDLLASELMPVGDLCMMTGAVMLSLLECFDARKFGWLLDAYAHSDVRISQRALVGMAIVLQHAPDRLPLYPELTARLSLLDEEGKLGKDLNRVYIQLLRSKETEKINKKMREEILPEMMRSMRHMKFGFEDSNEENDRNPDWQQNIMESGIGDRLREMSEMQLEGSDLYMSTFSQLKGFPFFQQAANWFRLFDLDNTSIAGNAANEEFASTPLMKVLMTSGNFCESDKYSLFFLMRQLPETQRERMLQQFAPYESELMHGTQSAALQQIATRPDIVSNMYVHDLYRFFKLNRMGRETYNVFDDEIEPHHIAPLHDLLCKPALLKEVADFCFGKEHHVQALALYQTLAEMHQSDADTFQKTGFCLQKEKRYKEAIEAYRKADTLKPDHVWTIRHLATCHRLNKDFATALEYYQKAESIQPENTGILFYAGSCLAELERYEEALQYFFKMDFMEANCVKAWRAIGWCSFMSGKSGQAMRYYEKVIALKPVATDYLNAGHVAWVMHNLDKAIDCYQQAVTAYGSKDNFLESFAKDRDILTAQGIAEKDIPLVLDLV